MEQRIGVGQGGPVGGCQMWNDLRKPRNTSLTAHEERSLPAQGVTSGLSGAPEAGRVHSSSGSGWMLCSKASPTPFPSKNQAFPTAADLSFFPRPHGLQTHPAYFFLRPLVFLLTLLQSSLDRQGRHRDTEINLLASWPGEPSSFPDLA